MECEDTLIAACETLMGDIGDASIRAVAIEALDAYRTLDDGGKRRFFTHVTTTYGVDDDRVRDAFHRWERERDNGSAAGEELTRLFDAVEPARQQLLRRLNHAPGATLSLVEMRSDLRRLMRDDRDLRPLDHDFHHLLTSWFNRGFLQMIEVTRESPAELRRHLLHYETVHPMSTEAELRRRLLPEDRRIFAFVHPATNDVPLIFVEIALVRGVPHHIEPLLEPGTSLDPGDADTAALYSINNALDGLAGVSFGSLLIKQVIEQVSAQLPHLRDFVTLSPIPGFRAWLAARAEDDPESWRLVDALDAAHSPSDLAEDTIDALREPLLIALSRYLTVETRSDGRPVDPVARFHLGNGATAWRLNWPADTSPRAWSQSYGAMVNYRYEPDQLEQRHEAFVRHRDISVTGPLSDLATTLTASSDSRGTTPMEHDTTMYRLFADQASRRPDAPLFELPGSATVTYGETSDIVHAIAARLVADGVTPGDRVAAQVPKSPEALALYLATLQIGGVFLPLNTAYTDAEMRYFLGDARPRVLVCSPDRLEGYSEHLDSLVIETLGANSDGTLLSGDGRHLDVHDAATADPAAILYTSGTTGRSKGAVLTHGNLVSNCEALIEAWQFTSNDRLIHALPIFHVHGLFVAANMTIAAGASMHFLPTFDAETVVDLLPRATVLMGVPTFYTRLAATERLTPEHCATMRLFVSGSAPLLAADHEAFAARTGHAILERYGMTETGMNTTNPYEGGPRKPGTVGKPLPGTEIRVVGRESGEPVADGEVGIVEVRGPNVFSGYWQMPEKTASEFRADGFFVTGDLGTIDEDGYLCIVGRDKDLVISGGYNIYPKEIEEALDEHPSVLESAVIGVPHPDFGETVVAVVVTRQGHEVAEQELLDFVAGDLARFKQPRAVRVVPALPRNVMGKVQKAQLRATYAGLFDGAIA
ncbi:AMP-binding protein [Rhodococcus sp. BP-349]|uniref:AMP-binding protein n=1 Tax=unclassified Rhodococcus (in: high G+C Gram-positive bacteria) TaxID=192944 RepID=UPI001DC9ECDA|nr:MULTISPECIES: AMP-binding protein [unclassified Rhodococcus (in: high G+C Gram-positive bacteria)]MBY6539897.1 AMP-binding protein [Rhodococcus sp. BP-363]MBY6543775.1 AMP-binding protein [Rhodococcus sp. BP-369]MBY6563005.1 AMP-binding protein [Rhodococcus sp. BP-370]MBY6577297.1 AMP-binding protein [Rhodococcus sp. BP-364]MBY6586598.1 AMP-binding protein [Rhodococcus sp. BP-358]